MINPRFLQKVYDRNPIILILRHYSTKAADQLNTVGYTSAMVLDTAQTLVLQLSHALFTSVL